MAFFYRRRILHNKPPNKALTGLPLRGVHPDNVCDLLSKSGEKSRAAGHYVCAFFGVGSKL